MALSLSKGSGEQTERGHPSSLRPAPGYADTLKHTLGIRCADCHLPAAGKSAEVLGPHRGDVQTHLFRINTDARAYMFENDRTNVRLDPTGQAAVTLDFACLQCHQ